MMKKSTILTTVLLLFFIYSPNLNVIVGVRGQPAGNSTISGTVRCHTGCDAVDLADNSSVNVSGSVRADMTVALDPTTGSPRPDLPIANAETSFDVSANGHYELTGLLPGAYDLYASADGYQTALFASGVIVLKNQNLVIDAYLNPCSSASSSIECSTVSAQTVRTIETTTTPQLDLTTMLILVCIVVVVIGAVFTIRRGKTLGKSQPEAPKSKKKNSFLLADAKAIWLVVVLLGGMFTVIQLASSFVQLSGPLLSYNVTKAVSFPILLETTMIVPYNLTIRNDGFQPSNEVDIAVVTNTNTDLTNQYVFERSSLFFWSDYSRLSDCDVNGPESTRCTWIDTGFFMKIPQIPSLTTFSFAFNATMPNPTITLTYNGLTNVPSTVSVFSDGIQIPEYSQLYQAQIRGTQLLFYAHSSILTLGLFIGLPWAIRQQRKASLQSNLKIVDDKT